MASIKQFNLPKDGKLGFRNPQSDPQFDWRNNPSLVPYREYVKDSIKAFLAQNASGNYAEEMAVLAACMEHQLFMDSLSENDYVDQEKLLGRLRMLISQRWYEASSAQQEAIHATTSIPVYASTPTIGLLENINGANFNKPPDERIMSAGAACNFSCAPNLLADVPRSSVYGSQKGIVDTNQKQPEAVLPSRRSSGVGFSNAESTDSGPTFSGSVLQYDSEASFESRRYKSLNLPQGVLTGDVNMAVAGDQRSQSVHAPAMVGRNSKFVIRTLSDGNPMLKPVSKPPKFEKKLSQSETRSSGHPRDIKYQDATLALSGDRRSQSHTPAMLGRNSKLVIRTLSGGIPMQQPVSKPLQFEQQFSQSEARGDGHPKEIKYQDATLTSNNLQKGSADSLLCCYIAYNCRNRMRHEVPFLEYLHKQKCKDDICSCYKYKLLLSHFDYCGSADCGICGPAVRICSANGFVQPGLEKKGVGFKGSTRGSNCGKRVCAKPLEDFMSPAKFRKLNSSPGHDLSSDVSVLTEEPISLSGPLKLEQASLCPVMGTMANSEANREIIIACHDDDVSSFGKYGSNFQDDAQLCEPDDAINISESSSDDFRQKVKKVTSHIDDDAEISQNCNGSLHDIRGSNSDAVSTLSNIPSAEVCQKEIEPAIFELKHKVPDSHCELASDSVPNFCDPESVLPVSREGFPPTVASCTETKSEKQMVEGISLIDFFTPEEIKQHISSLRRNADQGTTEEIVGNTASCSLSENFCQLCGLDKLAFSPMPIYCSSCGTRIKNNATYYSTKDENSAQFCFCTSCYNKCPRGSITILGQSISKTNLEIKKNDLVTVESWVQCDRCEGWQHQVCALFNDKKDLGGKAEYLCPICYLKDLEIRKHMPLPRSTSLNASNLPQTLLSNHLEQRLLRCLKQESENRGKAAGINPEEVLQPADLVVRVVSAVDKKLAVKQQFLDIFPEKNYPAEFPYRSKVILLFQRIEGVDVCLFAMYVQEFGSDCSQPNQRCVYISYLDSVKYFRPEIKTVKGEALRTFVYHEILVGYLDYCKKRGFATCYIWACPPVKGEDYILYCHPETQKTPRPDKLRQWYQSMLKKATEEKVLVNFSNLYEKFFVPAGESNTKVTAARLPYFDGDYWSSVAENMIKKIDLESGGDPQKQIKKMTRRSLKAMGHINPSADDAKDILLMQALGQNISSAKEDFIIVYLHFICTHCHEVILSGQRWFCNQCKNYQLCGRCHGADQQSGLGNTHISSSGQTHALSQEMVNDVPLDTEDNDSILDNCFLENRHAFLSFCQGNHYQFDSLRRAKHSSMMILYHLQNPNGSDAATFCSLCLQDTGVDQRWICETCPDFSVCGSCYQKSHASCHNHPLIHHLSTAIKGTDCKRNELVQKLLAVLLHASRCRTPINHSCPYPNCVHLRRLFSHAHACNIRAAGGCRHCKKTWLILFMHSQRCKDSNCRIPRCMDLKNHVKGPELVSKTPRKNTLRLAVS